MVIVTRDTQMDQRRIAGIDRLDCPHPLTQSIVCVGDAQHNGNPALISCWLPYEPFSA
jgi:hypothetical protein